MFIYALQLEQWKLLHSEMNKCTEISINYLEVPRHAAGQGAY